jgi:hypothetical protein
LFNFDTVNTSKKLCMDNFSFSEKYFIIVLNYIISFSSFGYKHYKYLLIALIFFVKLYRQFLPHLKKKTKQLINFNICICMSFPLILIENKILGTFVFQSIVIRESNLIMTTTMTTRREREITKTIAW